LAYAAVKAANLKQTMTGPDPALALFILNAPGLLFLGAMRKVDG
jgi:hypothetical protein